MYSLNICVINLVSITVPTIVNIVICLLDASIKYPSPPMNNRSCRRILVLVNISTAKNRTIINSASVLLDSVIGKCSFMFCVVFPAIVLYKYVYGTFPSGVSSPVNIHIIMIIIRYFTFLSFVVYDSLVAGIFCMGS